MGGNVKYLAALCLMLGGCRADSSLSESNDENDLNAEMKTMNAVDFMFSAGLVSDMNEQSHSQRKNWFVSNITSLSISAEKTADMTSRACQLALDDGKGLRSISLDENAAYPIPRGKVLYCAAGKLGWAQQDNSLRDRAIALGVSENEILNTQFFRVPIDSPNSFSMITENNQGIVAVFEGMAQFAKLNALDVDSVLSGIVAHEIGNILEMRKNNQTEIKSTIERLRTACLTKSLNTPVTADSTAGRMEYCRKNMRTNSRLAKYAADEFVIHVIGKKKYAPGVRPTELSKFFRIQSSTGRDQLDAHPDALERAIQFERNLERAGINLLTGGMIRPGDEKLQ